MDKYLKLINTKKQEVEFLRNEILKLEDEMKKNTSEVVDLDSDRYELKTKIKQLQLKKEKQEQRPQELKRKRLKWIIEAIIVFVVGSFLMATGSFIGKETFSITINQFLTLFCFNGILGTLAYLYDTKELRSKRSNIDLIIVEEEIAEKTQQMEAIIKKQALIKEKNSTLKENIKIKQKTISDINRKITAIERLRTEVIDELLNTVLAQSLNASEIPAELQQTDVKVKKLAKDN